MKTPRFSLLLAAVVLLLPFMGRRITLGLFSVPGQRFSAIILYALAGAAVLVSVIVCAGSGGKRDCAAPVLGSGLNLFFLISRPLLFLQLGVAGFYLLGAVAYLESRKKKIWLPLILFVSAAAVFETVGNLRTGSHFLFMNVWIHFLAALGGYVFVWGIRK